MFDNKRLIGEFCYIKEELRLQNKYLSDICNFIGKPRDISHLVSLSACCYVPKTICSQLEDIEKKINEISIKSNKKTKRRK